jgi:hypothetical protein
MIETSNRPKPRIILLIWMILSQLAMVATLFVWIFVIGAAFVIASGGTTVTMYWIQAIVAGLYPIVPLTLVVGSWIAYSRHNNRMAAFLSGLSFVIPIPFLYLLMNM